MKRKTIKADEYNVVGWMRPYIGYLARTGAVARVKRRMRRRERHDAKHQLRQGNE